MDLIEQILSIVFGVALLVAALWLLGNSIKGCLTLIAVIVVIAIVWSLVSGALNGGDLENIVVSLPQFGPGVPVPELARTCSLTLGCLG